MYQCVDNELWYLSFPSWANYPISINYAGDPSVCHKITNDPNHSYKYLCAWSTPNPVKTLSFPDNLEPFLPPSTSKYVIYEVYAEPDCSGDIDVAEGGILEYCLLDDETGMYLKRQLDGTVVV